MNFRIGLFIWIHKSGTASRTRTGTGSAPRQILSLLCLPFHHGGIKIRVSLAAVLRAQIEQVLKQLDLEQ